MLESIVAETLKSVHAKLMEKGNPLAERLTPPANPFPRLTFGEAQEKLGHTDASADLGTEDEKRLGDIVAKEWHSDFYFITDFPSAIKKQTFYARRKEDDPQFTEYFDLYHGSLELASGGPREHRIEPLLANMRDAGVDPAKFSGYLEAFRFGMPPHGGWGFGVDRFVMGMAGLANLREARLFPRDRYRLEP